MTPEAAARIFPVFLIVVLVLILAGALVTASYQLAIGVVCFLPVAVAVAVLIRRGPNDSP
jgi:hypothetical protein